MKESYDVLIVGVGGQGIILASNILGEACLVENRTVRGAETHGMAQRGGSVESHIRIDGRHGPLIAPGTADLMIAFDMLEALRYRHYLPEGGTVVLNRGMVVPTSVYVQGLAIPTEDDVMDSLGDLDLAVVDAEAIAVEAGSPLTQNVVLLGLASRFLPLRPESLIEAVKRNVPAKTVGMNLKAFERGREEYLATG